MIERSKELTPPIADFLIRLEENRSNFSKGIFPANGWIAPADDGVGYVVHLWDKFGPTVEFCPTSADVVMRLIKARDATLTRQYVARQISHEFYQKFYEAVDARKPRSLTEVEAKLCGIVGKINEAMLAYTANVRETAGRKSTPDVTQKFRRSALGVDRLLKRAHALYAKVSSEAAAVQR
jgi:hypothetical protein